MLKRKMKTKQKALALIILSLTFFIGGCNDDLEDRVSKLEQFNDDFFSSKDFESLLEKFSSTYLTDIREKLNTQSEEIAALQESYAILVDTRNKAEEALNRCDLLETEVNAAKEALEKAQADVARIERELTPKLTALEESVLALQQNTIITKVEVDANNNYVIKYKEGTSGSEKTITVAGANSVSFSKVTVASVDDLVYTFTIVNNGKTETYSIPAARDFITSIVVVSDMYIDNTTKKPAINIVLNTANGTSLKGVNKGAFQLMQGQTTRSSAIEDFNSVTINSIQHVTDSKVPNEFIVSFESVTETYKGIHLLWNPGGKSDVKVLSPAFDLYYLPITKAFYLLASPNGDLFNSVNIREQHNHGGTGCSNLATPNPSVTYYIGLKEENSGIIGNADLEKVEVEILKFENSIVSSNEYEAKNRSFWAAYDVLVGDISSDKGYDGVGEIHSQGFTYDYYNGNAVDYNADKTKYQAILSGGSSVFVAKTTQENGFTVSYGQTRSDEFTITKSGTPESGLYGVIVWVKRLDKVYSRGIGYIWIN